MKTITINADSFGDIPLNSPKATQPKLNIKINKVDLAVLDELARLTDDTRSHAVNSLIEKLVYDFFSHEVQNFDTRYLLADEADRRNPELEQHVALDKSWFYEIDPDGQQVQLNNRYYQQENFYSQEHDDIKSILAASGKK